MISVIIPLYNKEQSIIDTINSVLNQTFLDFELIIVNDGSTDNSLNVVNKIVDNRIRIINKANGGVSSARNVGILEAKFEYIAFLDGDDIWHEKHLEILYTSLIKFNKQDIGGIGTTFYKSSSKIIDRSKIKKADPVIVEDYFKFMVSPKPRFNSSTLLVLKSKIKETGLFNENLKYGEDVEFWFKLFKRYKLIYIDTITTIYFTAAENRSDKNVMPMDYRYHIFNYNDVTKSEKRYLDKLIALIIINYVNKKAFKEVLYILRMYPRRLGGVIIYIINLIFNKIKGL